MESVTHHGRETVYRTADRGGGGPTVLFVHGSGGTKDVWKSQLRIADEYPVVALDLSGHGESDDADADAGYEALSAYVDDVLAVTEETGASVLVGNSLGGAVALTAVIEREVSLDALVLAGTGARLSVLDDLLAWLRDDFERAVEFLHEPDRLFHDPSEEYVEQSREAMLAAGRAVTERDFLTCHDFDVRGQLDDVDAPTLALVGEHDKLTPRSYHEYFVHELPDCELAVVEDAAHLAMLEAPTAFNAALTDFLDRRAE
ncbi:alpha/beta fold hydrolase [Halopelagius fulvigenes]|uniref:Alpha/beta fold hydrolase n=1 Tax=Halopelagius fulvigenes TaxID=1198324 RepID=A0ABD5TYV4_9EURY